jgi:D-glycero-alpha-D-manno-heptose 1-phosphate guanylyltransferase
MIGEVTAVILAGGLGTRLRAAVSDRPKVLADVAGQPFLERIFEQLQGFGLRKVVVCTGYMAEQIEHLYQDSFKDLSITYSREHALLGTAGAVRFALEQITTDRALVLNGDSYCDFDYRIFKSFHEAKDAEASLLLTYVDDCSRYGSVVIDEEGKIESFIEKSGAGGAGFVNAGVYLMDRALIKEIPPGRVLSLEKDIFPQWLSKKFYGHASNAPMFIDIGTPQSFQQAQSLFSWRTNS